MVTFRDALKFALSVLFAINSVGAAYQHSIMQEWTFSAWLAIILLLCLIYQDTGEEAELNDRTC